MSYSCDQEYMMFLKVVTVILFSLFCAETLAQYTIPDEVSVSYSCEDKALREVIIDLGIQTDVTIAFQEEIIPGDSIVSLSVRRQPLGKVLDFLIEPHGLKYRIVGNQIVIRQNQLRKVKDKITVSGYMRDADSGEGLVAANVYLFDKSLGTITNEYGFYSITLPKGVQRIYFSYLGYNQDIREITLKHDTTLNVYLTSHVLLNEIVIVDSRVEQREEEETASVSVLPLDQIASTISLGGEPDVIRLAYTMPGVNSGADGFGGMSVRGGSNDQNLILLDGVPVYNSNHALGLFSIFNSNVIKSSRLYKGAFPAHYAGRLSSVMDIRTREGNNQKLSGDFTVGLLALKGTLEGPLAKDKSSFLISVRRTFLDPWIRSLTEYINESNGNSGNAEYYFFDLNAKLNFQLGKKSKVYLSWYNGTDQFDNLVRSSDVTEGTMFKNLDELQWDAGNTIGSFRFNSQLSQKSFANFTAYFSKYTFNSFDHDRVEIFESSTAPTNIFYTAGFYKTEISDVGLTFDLDFLPHPKHYIKLGAGYINHRFHPGLVIVDQSDKLVPTEQPIQERNLREELVEPRLTGKEFSFFIEDNINLGKYSHLNIGWHHLIVNTNRSYSLPQPRVLLKLGSAGFSYKASFGLMSQYLHLLTNSGIGVPIDVWLPSTSRIEPQKGWIASTGAFVHTKGGFDLGMEVYYKKFDRIIAFDEGGIFEINKESNWEDEIPVGTGRAYGAEFSFNKSMGRLTWMANYTLAWSFR